MNRNTIETLIKEKEKQINESSNNIERAELADEIKKLQTELKALDAKGKKKKDIKLKTNIDAPLVMDRKEKHRTAFSNQMTGSGDSFVSMI